MSNREKAVQVAAAFLDGDELAANIFIRHLSDAGLLAPDTTGTLASMWARGKAQLADLALFKASGAPIPQWAYERAPKGDVTFQDLIHHWANEDLPKPNIHGEWELSDGITVTADEDEIAITAPIKDGHTIICWHGTPTQAQELAHALQAAANHHKENPNWMNPSS